MISRVFYGTDPFNEMRRLQAEMSRLLEATPRRAPEYPAINAYANQDSIVLTAELPGVDPQSLNVSVHRDTLSIRGERPAGADDGKGYHRRERPYGTFLRTLSLPFVVDPNKVDANMENGVLRLTLQRAEEDKPKRIKIQPGAKKQTAPAKAPAKAKKQGAAARRRTS